jgi:hypothetical protein
VRRGLGNREVRGRPKGIQKDYWDGGAETKVGVRTLGKELLGVRGRGGRELLEGIGDGVTALAATCRAPRSLFSGHVPHERGGSVSWVSWRCMGRNKKRSEKEKKEKARKWLEMGVGARDALLGEGGLSRGHWITDRRHG